MVNNRRFRNIVVLIILVFICLVIITISFRGSGLTDRIKASTLDVFEPVQEKIFSFFNPVAMFFSSIGDYVGLRQKYLDLEEENTRLIVNYTENTSIRIENDALRKLLDLGVREDHDTIAVKVIGFYGNRWQSEVIINAGTSDGVLKGMGVVGIKGLCGIIISEGNKTSSVRLLSDTKSSLGARILSSRKLGLVEGSQDGNIYLRYISTDEQVYKGDIIVTSEYGQYLPPDILIGRVRGVSVIPGNPYLEIIVDPFEDFKDLEYLMVIK
ncbi:MAG: rod shape-determining protein MreC [Actinobacteria bacterium]|nr:rod shape-determining protein MreC [Actinomycetota bacterium]